MEWKVLVGELEGSKELVTVRWRPEPFRTGMSIPLEAIVVVSV